MEMILEENKYDGIGVGIGFAENYKLHKMHKRYRI